MKWYITFGDGQPNEGCAMPIISDCEASVRAYAYEEFNGRWCGTYSEEVWEKWKNEKPAWIPIEREMKTVDITSMYEEGKRI